MEDLFCIECGDKVPSKRRNKSFCCAWCQLQYKDKASKKRYHAEHKEEINRKRRERYARKKLAN